MAAEDNLNPQQFYHGTRAALSEGDLIEPGHRVTNERASDRKLSNVGEGRRSTYTHATTSLDVAGAYAQRAALPRVGRNWMPQGEAHVYEVAPLGEHEQDPDGRPGVDIRSKHPMRVTKRLSLGAGL